MRITSENERRDEEGSILAYFVILLVVAGAIASLGAYVTQSTRLSARRSAMIAAKQFAIGAAVIAARDLNTVVTNASSSSLGSKLMGLASAYTFNSGLSTSTNNVYQRTISSPFSNQTVVAEIVVPVGSSPNSAQIVTTATVRSVTQSATVNINMAWGYAAAIISVNQGTTDTSNAKSSGQAGNVAINGGSSGPIVVDGGPGLAVLANGRVNYDTNYVNPPVSAYSMTNWGTVNQVPDYTAQGTANSLFDFNRFIALANATPGGYSPSGNNHFTNIATFITAAAAHGTNNPMQGVVVVDVWQSDKNQSDLTSGNLPQGINIHGTWMLNFLGAGWDPVSEKIIVTASININAANLSTLVPSNPATYPTGYPPVYTDSTKNPININIAPAYANFVASDDLPAEIYTIGCLDMHGNADICGVGIPLQLYGNREQAKRPDPIHPRRGHHGERHLFREYQKLHFHHQL